MNIREAEKEDLDKLVQLWIKFNEVHDRINDWVELEENLEDIGRSDLKEYMQEDEKRVLVAEGEELAGFVSFSVEEHPDIIKQEEIGVIDKVFVKKEYRNEGIASQLVKEAEAWFDEEGLELLKTRVAVENRKAQSFWSDKGFENFLTVKFKEL